MQGCTAQGAGWQRPSSIAKSCHPDDDAGTVFAPSRKDMERPAPRPPTLRPIVGITACLKENGRGGWHHTVGDKYIQAAIRALGALPVLIPAIGPEFDEEAAMTAALDRVLDGLDGVLL